jgi:hypothetical protein
MLEEKRGSFEGAIRIPLHASSFLFNDLAFLVIPRKFLRFLTPLFSIPTARLSFLHFRAGGTSGWSQRAPGTTNDLGASSTV